MCRQQHRAVYLPVVFVFAGLHGLREPAGDNGNCRTARTT